MWLAATVLDCKNIEHFHDPENSSGHHCSKQLMKKVPHYQKEYTVCFQGNKNKTTAGKVSN